jgi:hypothetical protein
VVDKGVVKLEGLIYGDLINEERGPIYDSDSELPKIIADTLIIDPKLYLVVSDI